MVGGICQLNPFPARGWGSGLSGLSDSENEVNQEKEKEMKIVITSESSFI